MRAGNRNDDLNIARDIIASKGTLFAPQAVIVATWYKVEAYDRRAGPQNTFQLAMAYSSTGETWLILAYAQLQFFQAQSTGQPFSGDLTLVEYSNRQGGVVQNFFTITSNATMNAVLNGTNCNRTGIYAYRINQGGPTTAPIQNPAKAPTKAPTKAPIQNPAKCGLLGFSIVCPLTLCGILGRWLGFCKTT
jgi:Nidogen-like